MRSSSTSVRCSTLPRCDRSRSLHLIPTANAAGVDALKASNVHTIAIQVPISTLTRDGSAPTDPMSADGGHRGLGAARAGKRRSCGTTRRRTSAGPWVQVSRLGNPLFNEVIVPMAEKDEWNARRPTDDKRFAKYVAQPELARLLPVLYPGVFPNLAGAHARTEPTCSPSCSRASRPGIIPGFQNFTGSTQADMLRLNVAIPPSGVAEPVGDPRRRPRRVPERPPAHRRRRDDRAAGGGRRHVSAREPVVHARRRGRRRSRTGHSTIPGGCSSDDFPYIGTPYSGYDVPAA